MARRNTDKNPESAQMQFLCDCSNALEAGYFVDELERQGIKCFIDKEHIPVSRYPTSVGRLKVFVLNDDYDKALVIYNELTGADQALENEEVPISNTEWEGFLKDNETEVKRKQRFRYWILCTIFSLPFILTLLLNINELSFTSGTLLAGSLGLILFLSVRFRPK